MRAKWPGLILKCAGVYNLAWGLWAIVMPMAWFDMLSIERPVYPQLWQCIGMIVGVYGIGYLIASTNHARHWPIVLVGLLGKIFGPIGFLSAALRGELPWRWGWTILTNDLIWWLPFVAILWDAFKENTRPQARHASYDELLAGMVSQRGATLAQLSDRHPVLLVFLRHSGCVFCREALDDLATTRSAIEAEGAVIAIAHMSTPMRATQLLSQYRLEDLHRFSDPTCALYHAFGLVRGKPLQLLGPRIWIRGAKLFARGYAVGSIDGDGFQMPGAFVIKDGKIIRSFRHTTAADRPNYLEMVQSAQQELIGSVYDRLQSAS